jgi:hypothetical protein
MDGPPKPQVLLLCATLGLVAASLACGGSATRPTTISATSGFQQANLISDTTGSAAHTDPLLLNPWGLAIQPGQSFWASNNNRGSAKVFDVSGNPAVPFTAGSSGENHGLFGTISPTN